MVSSLQCKRINYFSLPSVYSSLLQHGQMMQAKGSGIFYDDTLRTARKSKSCQLRSRCEIIPIPAHRKATHSENVAAWITGAQCFSHPYSLLSLWDSLVTLHCDSSGAVPPQVECHLQVNYFLGRFGGCSSLSLLRIIKLLFQMLTSHFLIWQRELSCDLENT